MLSWIKHFVGAEKRELKDLLEEENKKEFLRRLPLYSSSITGYRFFCSECYDKAYSESRKKDKK